MQDSLSATVYNLSSYCIFGLDDVMFSFQWHVSSLRNIKSKIFTDVPWSDKFIFSFFFKVYVLYCASFH